MENGAEVYNSAFLDGLRPDPILTVSQWADQHRYLSNRASAEPGQWRTIRVPYLREIMDCLSASSLVEEVVIMKGAQVGGTEVGNNWIGYSIDHDPCPMMMVLPSIEMAKRSSKQRIQPLIEESPRLAGKVKPNRERDSGNTILLKEFVGGVLAITGANSSVGLRSLPARKLFTDEEDAYPGDVEGEGDPVELGRARMRTFSRRKHLRVSTPTIEGRSRISAAYEDSDQRRYFVPCPFCGIYQTIEWARIKWKEGKPDTAALICEGCAKPIPEHHKTAMMEMGEWRAQKPGARGGRVAGFHISSLYSPLGWFSWRDAAETFLTAKDNPDKLRAFINTVLGETWKQKGDAPEWQRLYERREAYAVNQIPRGASVLVAGADVQKDRIEVEVVAYARDKQSWSIDYRVIPGDTTQPAEVPGSPWAEMNKLLSEDWAHPSGARLALRMIAVDSGYNTQHVYSWARKHPLSRVMVVKGSDTQQIFVSSAKAVDVAPRDGKPIKRGVKVWKIGVSKLKEELYSWLRLDKPVDGQPFSPGYCHFPEYGDEFFRQLTAEQIVVRVRRGFRIYEWEKTRERNEALDCRIYARAAASLIGVDRFSAARWDEIEIEVGVTTGKNEKKQETQKKKEPSGALERKKSRFWNDR